LEGFFGEKKKEEMSNFKLPFRDKTLERDMGRLDKSRSRSKES